jgi:AcrR family transcriptional regulator
MAALLTYEEVEAARARILAVSERQFATLGAEQTSWRTIASELGWSPSSLYRYFKNKSELLAATRAAAQDRFSGRIETAYASTDDLWDRSRAIGQAYVDFAFAEPHAYRLIYSAVQPDADKTEALRIAEARSRRTLTTYIEDMADAGLLEGDPVLLGHVYWAGIHGLILLHMAGKLDKDLTLAALRHELARLLTRGARPGCAG